MRILYSAPDIDLSAKHGGSSHVIGAVDSFLNLGNRIFLIVENGKINSCAKTFKTHKFFPKQIRCFLMPFIITFFLCLFNRIDLVYERARIFGGGAVLAGKLFNKITVYEMIEPYTEAVIYTNQIKKGSFLKKAIDFWHRHIVANSDIVTVTHKSFLKTVPEEKAVFVKTGVDLKKFNPLRKNNTISEKYGLVKGKTFFYAGSFAEWHMLDKMIGAISEIIKKDAKVKLLMIGNGKKIEECKYLAKSLNVENNIIFTDTVAYDLIAEYINSADVCLALFDRNYEPFKKLDYFYSPIKLNEYKACGKPIIASNIGTLNDSLKNGINGYLVNEGNISEIISAMKKLLRNRQLSYKIGKTNFTDVQKNYNWDLINSEILDKIKCLKLN